MFVNKAAHVAASFAHTHAQVMSQAETRLFFTGLDRTTPEWIIPLNTTPSCVLFLMHPSNLDVTVESALPSSTHLLSVFEKVCQEIQAYNSQ